MDHMDHGAAPKVDRILLKHTLNMLVELGVQGKNVAGRKFLGGEAAVQLDRVVDVYLFLSFFKGGTHF